jgi:hypothetical protein
MPEAIRLPGYSNTYISYLSTAMATRQIAGITVPDTPLITAAIGLARQHLDDWAYNHVMRSWLFGTVVADKSPDLVNRDKELHSIAAILHDLGWDERNDFISNDKIFEVDGANAARSFIEQQPTALEWDHHRKQLLWDAIALHTYPPVALYKEPEVRATTLGIGADFRGPAGVPGGALTENEWQSIVSQFPKTGFKSGVLNKLCGFCRTKPETTYNTFVGEIGEALMDDYSRQGRRMVDLMLNMSDAD